MGKPKIEQVKFIGDYWEEFRGYCEALILRINGREKYIMHRYYEYHVPLYNLENSIYRILDNTRFQYYRNISNQLAHKHSGVLGRITRAHQIIEFKTLREMLENFPGKDFDDRWQKLVTWPSRKFISQKEYYEVFGGGYKK